MHSEVELNAAKGPEERMSDAKEFTEKIKLNIAKPRVKFIT